MPVTVYQKAHSLSSLQEALALSVMASGSMTDIVYDGSNPPRITSYKRNGVDHTIVYGASTATITNTTGAPARVITYDGSGRVSGIV
jgi:hypothetical protein